MARSYQCECESNFTCGFCLRNAKPYFFTPSTQLVAPYKVIDQSGETRHTEATPADPAWKDARNNDYWERFE